MGFIDWLQLALIVLKFCGIIQAGWITVLSPYIIVAALAILVDAMERLKKYLGKRVNEMEERDDAEQGNS